MKKNLFSILLVVVMTMALVACGTKAPSSPDSEAVETVNEVVESADTENSEAVPETEQATEAPVDEATSETESAESASEPETSTEVLPDSEAVESEASEPETNEPEFTVTDLNATKYAIQVVNVRSGPSTDYDKIGGLTTNQEITVNGVCDQTGWYRFTWTDGREAYVSDRYVSDSKVEKPAASETPSNGGNSTAGTGSAASNSCPYTLWQPVDNGTSITWYCAWPDPEWDTKHKSTLDWIYQTLNDRNTGSIPEGMIGGTEQTESTIMGYYAEGEVRRQTYEFHLYPAN